MLIVRIKNYIFKDPKYIMADRVTLGGYELAAVRVKDCGGREMYFTVSDTEGATNRDILGMSEAIGREIGRKCAESPLPHMFINLDKVIADFWGEQMTKEEWRRLPKRKGMKVYTAKFNAYSRVRPCGMCEWTVESLYKDMATCRRTTGEDNIDRAAFPCEMLYTEEQAASYVKK